MEIFIAVLLFAVGIFLIAKGGDVFVDAARNIAKELNIPSFIIGATIVSIATTMPEMIVSFIAAYQGKTEMAIGNAVGSVTANTALIMAVAMLAMNIVCKRDKYLKQIILLISAAGVLWISCTKGNLNITGSIILGLIFILFMFQNIMSAKNDTAEDKKPADKRDLIKNIILFIIGAFAMVIGSRLMVDKGSIIASWLGVPERIIAVTLIAVGTSLPELVTTVTAIIKKESSLSIGNIIGANIIDLALILPGCSLISGKPIPVSVGTINLDLPVCFAATLIAMLPVIFKEKTYKLQGLLLLAVYGIYLISVI